MLRCVNRLAEAQEGSILLDGEEVLSPDLDVNDPPPRGRDGVPGFNLFAHLTAVGNVALGPRRVLGALGDGGPRPR